MQLSNYVSQKRVVYFSAIIRAHLWASDAQSVHCQVKASNNVRAAETRRTETTAIGLYVAVMRHLLAPKTISAR